MSKKIQLVMGVFLIMIGLAVQGNKVRAAESPTATATLEATATARPTATAKPTAMVEATATPTMPPKPGKVKKIASIQNVKTKIALSWEAAEGATGYLIYCRLSTATEYALVGSTEETTYQVTGLKAGKDYYFQIYAYAGETTNISEPSAELLYGTAPSLPVISKLKGGDRRVKVYWKNGSAAEFFNLYISTEADSGFSLAGTVQGDEYKLRGINNLKNKTTYYVKVEAVRTVSGITMRSESAVSKVKTASAAAKATSTKAKLFSSLNKLKKSKAYKKYKDFRKLLQYKKSIVMPGLITTNVGGFNATRMVPQSVAFAGDYLLMSAYDYYKKQESVLYIINKNTRKYISTIVLPHTGHVGGIAFDGVNVWLTYGKKLQSFKFTEIETAVSSGLPYYEIYRMNSTCDMPETVSYVAYYKNKIWAGAYNELTKKYMYGYSIQNKLGEAVLVRTNRILMPDRTQGVAFTSSGRMIVSRSCQTKKGQRGFMSQLDTYQPSWNMSNYSIKKNSRKKTVKMPPMNEGLAISGSYIYVIYESPAFPDCQYPLDRIIAFKTKKISE